MDTCNHSFFGSIWRKLGIPKDPARKVLVCWSMATVDTTVILGQVGSGFALYTCDMMNWYDIKYIDT